MEDDLNRFNNESPSVDLDANKTNHGELKELVEEVKKDQKREEEQKEAKPET